MASNIGNIGGYDGSGVPNPYSFRLTNYQKHKKDDDEFYSPPFYTPRPTGYKICIEVDANGWDSGKGTHVSVYAYLMNRGDNDDSLTWPFTGFIRVELRNQLEDKNHHAYTIGPFPAFSEASTSVVEGERGTGWGTPQFIPHTELDYNPDRNCQYLKDDTLIFHHYWCVEADTRVLPPGEYTPGEYNSATCSYV